MAYQVLTPTNAFVRFDNEQPEEHCVHGEFKQCLPVFAESDIAFQFVVQAETTEEADALCTIGASIVAMGLVTDCDQEEFDVLFEEMPERYRISDLQVLYNWTHGLPGMLGFYDEGECFFIRVEVAEIYRCSNCFQRLPDDCFTSVVEYRNDENFGGYNYCNSGQTAVEGDTTCEPTVIQFVNKETLNIPYTAGLQSMYGTIPTVQAWIYDTNGDLVNMGISIKFDDMPPTMIMFDFGGEASGIVKIR
jgi:hypothetical protein